MSNLTSGNYNVAFGYQAGNGLATKQYNVSIGTLSNATNDI